MEVVDFMFPGYMRVLLIFRNRSSKSSNFSDLPSKTGSEAECFRHREWIGGWESLRLRCEQYSRC